jgi:hypothetical protein
MDDTQTTQTTAPDAPTSQTTDTTPTAETTTPVFSFDDFSKAIPENYRTVFEKNGVKDFETLGKSYQGLLTKIGEKGLIPPKENATDEEKKAFQKEIHKYAGVPENGEYKYQLSEKIDPDYVSEEFLTNLSKLAYEKGVNNEAFDAIVNTIYEAYTADINAMTAEIQTLREKLGQEGTVDTQTQTEQVSVQSLQEKADTLMSDYYKYEKEKDIDNREKTLQEYKEIMKKIESLQK